MKTRYVVLALFSMLLFACPSSDDDSEEQEIVLTNENNLYEGDLYRLYLDDSKTATESQIEIVATQLLDDPNNEELQEQLISLGNNLQAIEANIATQEQQDSQVSIVPKRPRVPPVPPQPCTAGACIPSILGFLSISEDIQSVVVQFRDSQTEAIITTVSINQFTPLDQYNNLVSATAVDFQGYDGPVSINVQRINMNNETINYNLNGNIF